MIVTPDGRLAAPVGERRALAGSSPMGWGFTDPAAIPPAGLRSMSRAGVPVTVQTALQVDAVFTAMRVISNAIVKMGSPRAYTIGLDKLNRPYRQWLASQPGILTNTFGDMFQFDGMTRTVMSLGIFQEAWWYVLTRDYLQRPTALEVLNPAIVDTDKEPGAVWYGVGAQKRRLNSEGVIHIPFMILPGATRALSSIDYAGVNYALALAALEYGQRWFAQGASPSYLLTTEQKLGQDEVKRIAEKFVVEHSGLQAAHLPLVLDSGLKAEKIQATPDEAQYLKTLDYARSVIAAWYGLPSHLMGGANDRGNVWGRTVQEQGFQMNDYTLSGYFVRLDEAFSSLLPRGTFAKLDEDAVIRANSADEAKRVLAERTAGTKTINDIHAERGEPPVEGGDDPLLPLNSNTSNVVGAEYAQEVDAVNSDDNNEPEPDTAP